MELPALQDTARFSGREGFVERSWRVRIQVILHQQNKHLDPSCILIIRKISNLFPTCFERYVPHLKGIFMPSEQQGFLLSRIESEQLHWLWEKRIPRGKLTTLDGDPGLGKSLGLYTTHHHPSLATFFSQNNEAAPTTPTTPATPTTLATPLDHS